VGLAARRLKVTLTEPQAKVAEDLVATGQTPTAAIAAAAPDVKPPPAAKPKILAAEMKAYSELRRLGKSHAEAVQALEAARDFARRFGTPSSEEMRRMIAERNLSGQWPE
jgi:hypothetical protein